MVSNTAHTLGGSLVSTPSDAARDDKTIIDSEKSLPPPAELLYQHSWSSPDFAHHRRGAVKTFLLSNFFNIFVIWGAVATAYGAYYKNNNLNKIKVFVTDLDGGVLGSQIVIAFQETLSQPSHLNLIFDMPFTTVQEARDAVFDEQAWAAVVINVGASDTLAQALATGNTSYSPASAIELVSESGRNPLTAGSHAVPAIVAILDPAVAAASQNASATFLNANVGNTDALRAALLCPQGLSGGFAYTQNDLHPAYNAAAFGAMLSCAIALACFTFTVCGTANQIGMAHGHHLSIPSTVVWRLSTCLVSYLVISFCVTCVQASFGVPITAIMGHRGWMVLWMLNWMTVNAFGFALEAIVTIFGFWICNWFLNFWVFWHFAGAPFTAELMPGFYNYLAGFPAWQSVQGTLTIVYGTKSHLGANFGVLAGWTVGFAGLMSLATVVRLRWNIRQGVHALP